MNQRELMHHLKRITGSFVMNDGKSVIYEFDKRLPVFAGWHKICSENESLIHVGIQSNRRFLLSDTEAINSIVVLFHESRHMQQSGFMRVDSQDPIDAGLKLNSISCEDNPFWYRQNYAKNPVEVDAEAYALKKAWDYLSLAGFEDAEQLLLCRVNETMLGSGITYFVGPKPDGMPYESMDEVFAAFGEAYQKSFEESRTYPVFQKVPLGDDVYDGMVRGRGNDSEWLEFYDSLNRTIGYRTPGWETDRKIACYELFLHPEYKKRYESLLGFAPEQVFSKGFPQSRDDVFAHIRSARESGPLNKGQRISDKFSGYPDAVREAFRKADELPQDGMDSESEEFDF